MGSDKEKEKRKCFLSPYLETSTSCSCRRQSLLLQNSSRHLHIVLSLPPQTKNTTTAHPPFRNSQTHRESILVPQKAELHKARDNVPLQVLF